MFEIQFFLDESEQKVCQYVTLSETQKMMKKPDFVYFEAGGGHRAAANALKSVIEEQQRPWQVRLVESAGDSRPIGHLPQIHQHSDGRCLQPAFEERLDAWIAAIDGADACADPLVPSRPGPAAREILGRRRARSGSRLIPEYLQSRATGIVHLSLCLLTLLTESRPIIRHTSGLNVRSSNTVPVEEQT